jgi:hypothetical protein
MGCRKDKPGGRRQKNESKLFNSVSWLEKEYPSIDEREEAAERDVSDEPLTKERKGKSRP